MTTPVPADVGEECKKRFDHVFSSLRELYVFCEKHQRADIGGEVVDALAMCQEDFSKLVDRLRARGERGVRTSDGNPLSISLAAPTASPTASHSASPQTSASPSASPLAQLNSPESNSRVLAALEALELEELQEASRYFEVAGPMMPRKKHEAVYLERAIAEGREQAARRFLVTLSRMASTANAQRSKDGEGPATAPLGVATKGVVRLAENGASAMSNGAAAEAAATAGRDGRVRASRPSRAVHTVPPCSCQPPPPSSAYFADAALHAAPVHGGGRGGQSRGRG